MGTKIESERKKKKKKKKKKMSEFKILAEQFQMVFITEKISESSRTRVGSPSTRTTEWGEVKLDQQGMKSDGG
jgi:hypothetical protein